MSEEVKYLDSVNKVFEENKGDWDMILHDLMESGCTITRFTDRIERIDPLSREGITIAIQHEIRQKNTLEAGQLIKVKGIRSKRVFIKVTEGGYYNAKGISVYNPAPKSQLKTKSKFTKFKSKLM